jgi:hypothetical protein
MTKRNDASLAGPDNKSGYGNPPKHSQFKPKQSGNPAGRPKGAKNKPPKPEGLAKIIADEASRPIKVTQGGKTETVPASRVIVRRVMSDAANGSHRAQKLVIDSMTVFQAKEAAQRQAIFAFAHDYKMYWTKRIEELKRAGKPLPRLIPHPDSISLNFQTLEVSCIELMPDEHELIRALENALAFCQTMLVDTLRAPCSADDYKFVIDDALHAINLIKNLNRALGLPWSDDYREVVDFGKLRELKAKVVAGAAP